MRILLNFMSQNPVDILIFYVLLTVHPCIISQISPTRCTFLLLVFIFSSLHVSGIHVHNIRRILLYLWDTGTCHSVLVASGLLVGLNSIQTADQTPSIQSDKYQCRIDTVIFSWWWVRGCTKHVAKRNKCIKQNCASSWTYLRDLEICLLLSASPGRCSLT